MNDSTHSLAVRVEAKASRPRRARRGSPRLRLKSTGRKPSRRAPRSSRSRSSRRQPKRRKGDVGRHAACGLAATPGRDFAGVVVEGPKDLIGREVWGSGGETRRPARRRPCAAPRGPGGQLAGEAFPDNQPCGGRRRRGAFRHRLCRSSRGGLRKAGGRRSSCSAGEQQGRSGRDPARHRRRRAGLRRRACDLRLPRPRDGRVTMFGASEGDIAEWVREATGGHSADIVFNTVGSPYFEAANRAMAVRGRQIFISTIERSVPFDIFAFYRGQHRFIGVDTLALDNADSAVVLEAIAPRLRERGAAAVPSPGRECLSSRPRGRRVSRGARRRARARRARSDALGRRRTSPA